MRALRCESTPLCPGHTHAPDRQRNYIANATAGLVAKRQTSILITSLIATDNLPILLSIYSRREDRDPPVTPISLLTTVTPPRQGCTSTNASAAFNGSTNYPQSGVLCLESESTSACSGSRVPAVASWCLLQCPLQSHSDTRGGAIASRDDYVTCTIVQGVSFRNNNHSRPQCPVKRDLRGVTMHETLVGQQAVGLWQWCPRGARLIQGTWLFFCT